MNVIFSKWCLTGQGCPSGNMGDVFIPLFMHHIPGISPLGLQWEERGRDEAWIGKNPVFCFVAHNTVKKCLDFMSPWISMLWELHVSVPQSVVSLFPLSLCLSLSSIQPYCLAHKKWWITWQQWKSKWQTLLASVVAMSPYLFCLSLSLNRVLSNTAEIASSLKSWF